MNKIITTSVYGDNPRYIIGAKRQVELAKEFYPNWKFRIYADDASKFNDIQDTAEIVEIKDKSHGVFWRFMPMFESEDNVVIVRDADGRITLREQIAVNEWLASDKKFHTFRDHEAHFQFPVIACAFGYRGKLSNELFDIMSKFMTNTNYYTNDQVYLRDFVFPDVQNSCMIHSMKEGWFGESRLKLKNPFSFCGNGYTENDMPLYPSTLKECENFNANDVSPMYKFDNGALNN
jgi:hypothetical protein